MALVVEARCRCLPRSFNCATGLGTGSGTRVSRRSSMPSTRHTRMKPDNWVATAPDSSRSTVRLETPACSASWPWVRLRSSRIRASRPPSSASTASSVACFVIFTTRLIWRIDLYLSTNSPYMTTLNKNHKSSFEAIMLQAKPHFATCGTLSGRHDQSGFSLCFAKRSSSFAVAILLRKIRVVNNSCLMSSSIWAVSSP